jgi:hypothetical protein
MKQLLALALLVTVVSLVVAFTIPLRDDTPGPGAAPEAWATGAEELRAGKPRPGSVPDHENAALAYLRGFAALDGLTALEEAQCLGGGMVEPAPDADLIERVQGAIVAAHEAAALRSCDWQVAVTRSEDARSGHVISGRAELLAGVLSADAFARAEQGDLATAVRDVESLYDLAEHTATLSRPTALGLCASKELMAFATLSRIFRDREVPGTRLDRMLERRDYRMLCRQALHAEGSWVLANFADLTSTQTVQERRDCKEHYVRTMARLDETLDGSWDFSWLNQPDGDTSPSAVHARTLAPWPRDMGLVAGLETRAALVRAALELRAHRAKHAEYPAIWPSYSDAWSSEIRYRREAGGFVVSAADLQGKVIRLAWD